MILLNGRERKEKEGEEKKEGEKEAEKEKEGEEGRQRKRYLIIHRGKGLASLQN